MRRRRPVVAAGVSLALVALSLSAEAVVRPSAPSRQASGDAQESGTLFEKNVGQAPTGVRFLTRTAGATALFKDAGVILYLPSASGGVAPVTVQFLGASPNATIAGVAAQPTKINYLIGNEPSAWRTNVKTFNRVVYRNLWPGIDLEYGHGATPLKGTYVVAPRANPATIRWRYSRATVSSSKDGGLSAVSPASGATVTERPPVAWQDGQTGRRSVRVGFRLGPDGVAGFSISHYDHRLPLVIDPDIDWTRLDVSTTDRRAEASSGGTAVTVDYAGNTVVAGWTNMAGLGTRGSFDPSGRLVSFDPSNDLTAAYLGKFDRRGRLLWRTYLDGSGDDQIRDVRVLDRTNRVAFVGKTSSPDFPTVRPLQRYSHGPRPSYKSSWEWDGLVGVLRSDGTSLIFSSYLGSKGTDMAARVAPGRDGALTVGGISNGRPPDVMRATAGAFRTEGAVTNPVANRDRAYVARITSSFRLEWIATFDEPYTDVLSAHHETVGLGVDQATDDAYVAVTQGHLFPTTRGAYQRVSRGRGDMYAARLSRDGRRLVWASFVGGVGPEVVVDAVLTPQGFYLFGRWIGGAPQNTVPRAHPVQPVCDEASMDTYVAGLSLDGRRLLFGSCLGGSDWDFPSRMTADRSGNVYLFGATDSDDFPHHDAWQSFNGPAHTSYGADCFITKITPDHRLAWSSWFGGKGSDNSGPDYGGIAIDPTNGDVVATGIAEPPRKVPGASATEEKAASKYVTFTTRISQ
ncbi:MAG: hypothetical protein QOG53_3220 [Frankiales bacterium]|jgi:hypothetical protein|nr:hypothetical protein [Frankiales bacterium]